MSVYSGLSYARGATAFMLADSSVESPLGGTMFCGRDRVE